MNATSASQAVLRDTHEPVLPPVPLSLAPSSLANITGSAEQKQWHSTLDLMAMERDAVAQDITTIRDWITHGIRLELDTQPNPIVYENTYAVVQNADTVRKRLQEYIDFEAIIRLPVDHPTPFGIQPLHVIIKPNKKPRLVIDLSRNLNSHLHYQYFSYSSIADATDLSSQHCWYGKLDLSNCFLSFPLHKDFHPHFIFQFEGALYQFTRMPFGLSCAPRICTMLLSVVHYRISRELATQLVRYLDDLLFIASSRRSMRRILSVAQQIISSFGLVVNPDKTEGPSQRLSFLGIQLDSLSQTTSCTEERVNELLSLLREVLLHKKVKLSFLSTLIGKLSFAASVLPGARPFMRRMLDLKHKHTNRIRARSSPTDKSVSSSSNSHKHIYRNHVLSDSPADKSGPLHKHVNRNHVPDSPIFKSDPHKHVNRNHVPDSPIFKSDPNPSLTKSDNRLRFSLSHSSIFMDTGFKADVTFWIDHLRGWNGTQRWRSCQSSPICFATDASLEGFGFYLESTPSSLDLSEWPSHMKIGSGFSGLYSPCHSHLHSSSGQMTWCELFAVFAALSTYRLLLQNQTVLFYVDNNTDVAIINRQATRSARLAGLLREIYHLSLNFNISIRACHRAGVNNVLADFLSRPELHQHNHLAQWNDSHPSASPNLSVVSVVYSQEFANELVLPCWTISNQ